MMSMFRRDQKSKFQPAPGQRGIARYLRSTSGNVSIIFGLSATMMFGMGGAALDYARWLNVRNKSHSALDSAVLAGGRAVQVLGATDVDTALNAARIYYDRMKPLDVNTQTPTFSAIENDTVIRGEIALTVATPFLALFGVETLPVRVISEAVLAAGGNAETNVEVSMMLDTTGSMGGQKIEDMKVAAKDLVDIVVWTDQSQHTSKVAIAPFAPRVNVGDYAAAVTGMPATKAFGGSTKRLITCVTEREDAEAFTDAAPAAGSYVPAYKANNNENDAANYSASGTCALPSTEESILPLTSDKDALKSKIDGLVASGSTAGQLGTAWAWYLISPKWSSIWPSPSQPEPYANITSFGPTGKPRLQKIVVLMTDGVFNTYAGQQSGDTSPQATTVSNNTVEICNNMKAAGIKVYTVGFDLGGNALATSTLKSCASREPNDPADQPSYFYNTTTGDELRGAFRDIALKIATLRIRL